MTKVEFLETFNTSIGLMAVVNDDIKLKVGETIENQDGSQYRIDSIDLPSRPPVNGTIGLRLQPV